MKRVLITRAPDKAELLIKLLTEKGIDAIPFPLTETIDHFDEVPELPTYKGIAFTSSAAVSTTQRLLLENRIDFLDDQLIFVVGESTAIAVENSFGRTASMVGVQSGQSLGEMIIERYGKSISPVIWFCAEEAAPGLAETLRNAHIAVTRQVVYKTRPLNSEMLVRQFGDLAPFEAVFFTAPSAAKEFTRMFGVRSCAIAIGPTTANSLENLGWKNIFTSRNPTINECLNAILSALAYH